MKNVFGNVGNAVLKATSKARFKISKRSPEICMVIGAVTFVGTVVVACRQTLKCEEILDKHTRTMDDIENCLELASEEGSGVTYDDQMAKKDKAVAFLQTGAGFVKVYAPAIGLGVVSLVCFGYGFHVLKKRNLALTAAYTAIDTAFKKYRKRVVDELGEDSDKYFRYGYKKIQNAVVGEVDRETGKVKAVYKDEIDTIPWDEDGETVDVQDSGSHMFVFAPETSSRYFPDELINDTNISAVKKCLQVQYNIKGFLFLNDVLKELGMSEIPYGQLVGWKKGIGDDYLDFKVNKVYRPASKDRNRNPLGLTHECVYELDFNTCGLIWNKI